MRKIYRKLFVMLGIIILSLNCFCRYGKEIYASHSNKYLVLVQQKDNSWKVYKNMIEKSSSGNLMIKAKSISKALGLNYKKNSNATFVIKRSTARFNIYTKNNNKFIHTNGAETTINSASNKVYTSKRSKNNLCQVNTLNTLVHYRYFNNTKLQGYKKYSEVMCFSRYKKIPASPPILKPEPTKIPTPTPMPEPTSISIEGVKFPVRGNFLSIDKALSDWGGTSMIWYKLEQEVDGKIIPSTDLYIQSNIIGYSHLTAGSDGIYLTKAKKGYKISISVKLDGSVIADQNAAILKAMVVTISSRPLFVYKVIYESFTTNHTHGIKESSYVTVGDCKIKIKLKQGKVIYYIKEAKN